MLEKTMVSVLMSSVCPPSIRVSLRNDFQSILCVQKKKENELCFAKKGGCLLRRRWLFDNGAAGAAFRAGRGFVNVIPRQLLQLRVFWRAL